MTPLEKLLKEYDAMVRDGVDLGPLNSPVALDAIAVLRAGASK